MRLGDLEKMLERLVAGTPPFFLLVDWTTRAGQARFLVSYMPLALSLLPAHARSEPYECKRRWVINRNASSCRLTRARRKCPARFLASAKHAAKPRPPERDLSSRQLFAALGLRTFSREELRQRFDAADADADGYLTRHEAAELFGGALDVETDRKAAASRPP